MSRRNVGLLNPLHRKYYLIRLKLNKALWLATLKDLHPKLTPELIEKLCELVRKGAYIETATAYCGISKDTFYRWLREGVRTTENNLIKTLSDALWVAQAEAEMRDIEIIDKAALGSPDVLARDESGNPILDEQGFPVILEYGLPPNWKAS